MRNTVVDHLVSGALGLQQRWQRLGCKTVIEEALVFAPTQVAMSALGALPDDVRLFKLASPRIAVVQGSRAALDAFLDTAELISIDESMLGRVADLQAGERLFVKAWSRNRETPVVSRPGDGLLWDATGFDPPDPPEPPRGSHAC